MSELRDSEIVNRILTDKRASPNIERPSPLSACAEHRGCTEGPCRIPCAQSACRETSPGRDDCANEHVSECRVLVLWMYVGVVEKAQSRGDSICTQKRVDGP